MESSIVVQLLLSLSVIIAATQLAGVAARLLHQPRVLGELMAGVVLGPSLLNMLHWSQFADQDLLRNTIDEFAQLGVLLLMFNVGLEVQMRELLAVGQAAFWSGVLGGLVPVALAIPVVMAFGYSLKTGIFIGVVLSATSVSISAQTLLELGYLRTREGTVLLASAVVDDVVAILLLSLALAVMQTGQQASVLKIGWVLVRIMSYLAGATALAWWALPYLFNRLHQMRYLVQGTISLALLAMLLFGWAAEALGGLAAITGAFIAGVGLSRIHDRTRHEIETAVRYVAYSLLVPIFFVNVGLHADMRKIELAVIPFALGLLGSAILSKIIGGGVGAWIGGFNLSESLRVGICRISRGEVNLIAASLGLAHGLLSGKLFQSVFLVILLTTMLTPPLVRWAFGNRPAA